MSALARVIDYETTGTPEDDDPEVIEMGSYDVNLTSRLLVHQSAFQSLCRPRGVIPPQTKAVHHICEEDVRHAPPARDLWDRLLTGNGEPAWLVAHNAKFEQHFTPPWGIPWIDTYKAARIVWPDAPGHSNQALRYWLSLPCDRKLAEPAHRALPDAYVTAHLFIRLLDHKTPEEMAKISEYPALIKAIKFGKYRRNGTPMTFEQCAESDPDYLVWIRDESDMDEDTKFTCRYWLQKRAKRLAQASAA
ncbi:exonuclease domain-containing protein [Mesorhizobium sp. M4A.F.Ca.ET.020.02.1.1]|uniref:exonuclease domain-containing protein n=1 Tax=Mesorhizobium sp. M4A.F.Ca.ET.020.02.1.1 TaxID=2496652 RepID=UPI001671C0D7|nr:exonuclease domain-containing protein [Mesorhizobium sp. M4A.F.Ca.ET.020.02.1.1]